jgi:hypothetical protein
LRNPALFPVATIYAKASLIARSLTADRRPFVLAAFS